MLVRCKIGSFDAAFYDSTHTHFSVHVCQNVLLKTNS